MSDAGEKHFEPTHARLAKARREGNTPRSTELAANASFAAAAIATFGLAPMLGDLCDNAVRAAASGRAQFTQVLAIIGCACIPMVAAAGAGAIAGIAQSGGLNVVSPSVKFERLNPIDGFKRMFSREAATHAARACIAFILAACALVPSLREMVAGTSNGNARSIASIAWSGAQHIVAATIGIGAVFAVAEFGIARSSWLKKLRMSFGEYKREMKENDGDPLVRSRRKALHRSLVRGSLSRVKDASFVVVNPTHVAVALEYRPPAVPVPVVLVRAADEGALRVRELANEHRVPIVENLPLARALFADASVGAVIPHEHYIAVAEIVAALRATQGERL